MLGFTTGTERTEGICKSFARCVTGTLSAFKRFLGCYIRTYHTGAAECTEYLAISVTPVGIFGKGAE